MTNLPSHKEVLALAERALSRARAPIRTLPARLVLVSPAHQSAHLIEDGRVTFTAPRKVSPLPNPSGLHAEFEKSSIRQAVFGLLLSRPVIVTVSPSYIRVVTAWFKLS